MVTISPEIRADLFEVPNNTKGLPWLLYVDNDKCLHEERLKNDIAYISGPMSYQPSENKQAFHDFDATLDKIGFKVLSPPKICPHPEQPWEVYMMADVPELSKAGVVFMLADWHTSSGACTEYLLARLFKIPILDAATFLPLKISDSDWPQLFSKITERIN